jgi:hypothetical protein
MNPIKPLLYMILIFVALGTACSPQPTPVAGVPTLMELPTITLTLTESPVPTLTDTLTPTLTLTPTVSPTPSDTPTVTVTVTPSLTITDTPTPTPTLTPMPTVDYGGLGVLAQLALQATILPQGFGQPTPAAPALPTFPSSGVALPPANVSCAFPPPGSLGQLYNANPTVAGQLGCPINSAVTSVNTVSSIFERGSMIYVQGSPGQIYALTSDNRFRRFDDTFIEGVDPESGGETPPTGLLEPVRGFGKVWRSTPDVRSGLGWALTAESGGSSSLLVFDRGRMLYLPQRNQTLVLVEDPGGASGTWIALPGGG